MLSLPGGVNVVRIRGFHGPKTCRGFRNIFAQTMVSRRLAAVLAAEIFDAS
jgi:hypothetical protein